MSRENIKLIVTVNGWQIVGEVTSEGPDSVSIKHPVNIVQHPDPSMNGKLVFMPYLQMSTQDECLFEKKDIMHILDPVEGLLNDWDKQFGSGLDIPQTDIILG